MSKTEKRKIGDIGENITARFLRSKGFAIIGKNYLKPWGEIDIIVQKQGKIHFIEVKTVSVFDSVVLLKGSKTMNIAKKCATAISEKILSPEMRYSICEIFEENSEMDRYRPEDNLHPWKLLRLKRAITSYLEEKRMSEDDDWQFDAVTIRLNEKSKVAMVEYLEDIIL